MQEMIELTIDDEVVSVPAGTTIYHAAMEMGVVIPTLCFHEYCSANALCRVCVVEVEGSRVLVPACVAKVSAGMVVHTDTPRVRSARKTILEMLAASVDVSDSADVLRLMQDYNARSDRFPASIRRESDLIDDNPMYVRDYSKCILCWRCVQVCAQDAQYTFAINFTGRGYETHIGTFYDRSLTETTCVFCGQCVAVCPTGALKPRREWLLEEKDHAHTR